MKKQSREIVRMTVLLIMAGNDNYQEKEEGDKYVKDHDLDAVSSKPVQVQVQVQVGHTVRGQSDTRGEREAWMIEEGETNSKYSHAKLKKSTYTLLREKV